MRRRPLTLIAVVLGLLGGCGEEAGRAPVARFTVSPPYIPLADDYQTDVTLDGTGSKDQIDDPEGLQPLWFYWQFDDPGEYEGGAPGRPLIVEGDLGLPRIRVRLKGDRPTTVTLTVLDADGLTATRTGYVGVTVPPDGGLADASAGD